VVGNEYLPTLSSTFILFVRPPALGSPRTIVLYLFPADLGGFEGIPLCIPYTPGLTLLLRGYRWMTCYPIYSPHYIPFFSSR